MAGEYLVQNGRRNRKNCPGRPGCREQLQTICSREADWEAAMAYLSGNNNGSYCCRTEALARALLMASKSNMEVYLLSSS